MDSEKISIIIPVYNAEKWIGRCLASIQKQTYKNFEVLVVDDGSEDDSQNVVKSYQEKDDRIMLFTQKNQGAAVARNVGLKNATGAIFTFVDADDYLEEDMYSTMMLEMQKGNADIVECSCQKVSEYGRVLQNICLDREEIIGKKQCVRHYLNQKNVRNYNWNKLYKKKLFHGVFYPELRFSEDYYINAIVHSRAEKKIILPDILYHYVMHDVQTTNINRISMANYDGVKAGALVAKYFRNDKELCTYAAIYACEYCIDVTKKYLMKYPGEWSRLRRYFGKEFIYCCLKISSEKNEKRKSYVRYILRGELEDGIFIENYSELMREKRQTEKKNRLFVIMHKWLQNYQAGIKISDYLTENSYLYVAVYGVGVLGECLLSELSGSDIVVKYVIEKRNIKLDIPVYTIKDELPSADCIIVTAFMDYMEIYGLLEPKIRCPVISLEDIIFDKTGSS